MEYFTMCALSLKVLPSYFNASFLRTFQRKWKFQNSDDFTVFFKKISFFRS